MTLLDFPGHVACTVFLGGCDFRCPFCHNYELVDGSAPAVMEEEEVFAFLEKRKGLLDGVAVTGGEPCLHRELPEFLKKVRAMGYLTKVDTNGNHPEVLRKILQEGLADYVAMDIKNSPAKYALTCGLEGAGPECFDHSKNCESTGLEGAGQECFDLSKIRESIGRLMESGVDHEFRTTVVEELHEEEDIREIGEMIRGAKQYFLQSFTDRDTVPYGNLHAPDPEKVREFARIAGEYVQTVEIRGID